METYGELLAAFAAAMATGDVSCIQEFFSLPKVVAQIARVEASITGVSVDSANPPDPWHLGPHLDLALRGAIQSDQYDVFVWLFAADRGDTMRVVLASFLPELVMMAIEYRRIGILDVMLNSAVFADKIADEDKLKLLSKWILVGLPRDSVDVIDVLVAYGACVNATQDEVREGHFDASADSVDALSQHGMFFVGADIKLADIIQHGGEDFLKALIDRGVAVDAMSLGKALHYAAQEASLEVVEKLLKHTYVDVDFVNENGRSALMMVTSLTYSQLGGYSGDPAEITTLLLEYGATVNLQVAWGSTPLHYACRSDLPEVVGVLLKNGADLGARSNVGERPQDEIDADEIKDDNISEILALLLEHGADLQATNEENDTMFNRLSESANGKAFLDTHAHKIQANASKRGRKRKQDASTDEFPSRAGRQGSDNSVEYYIAKREGP